MFTLNRISLVAFLIVSSAALATLTGCQSVEERIKAEPGATTTGFLPNATMTEQRQRYPFHRVWVSPRFNRDAYTKIMIAPVNTAYLMDKTGWSVLTMKDKQTVQKDVKELALYTRKSFRDAFAHDPSKRFDVVDNSGPNTLVAEMAITELVPSSPALGALAISGQAARKLAIALGSKAGAKAAETGIIAIEMRLKDGGIGAIVATMADRESAKVAPIDVQAVTWYGFAEEVIDDWAEQFVQLANTPLTQQIEDSSAFRLSPW